MGRTARAIAGRAEHVNLHTSSAAIRPQQGMKASSQRRCPFLIVFITFAAGGIGPKSNNRSSFSPAVSAQNLALADMSVILTMRSKGWFRSNTPVRCGARDSCGNGRDESLPGVVQRDVIPRLLCNGTEVHLLQFSASSKLHHALFWRAKTESPHRLPRKASRVCDKALTEQLHGTIFGS
jgi:hypothetical protein